MTDCESLLGDLQGQDTEKLRESAYAAGEVKCEEAIPRLAELLKSGNLGVQEAAELALRKIGGGKVVRAVIPLLRSDEASVRNLSMDILRQIGDQDFPALAQLLHDDDPDIRIFASDILGATGNFLAVHPLCEALTDDPEVNVRYQAAVGLGALAHPDAVPSLIKALKDEEWVQFAVVEALSKIKDESAVNALVKALGGCTDLVASMIVEALGEMGNVKSVPMLLKRMDASPTALRNKIVRAIINILGGKSLHLLAESERARFADYLLAALHDEDDAIQDAAMLGLGYLGDGNAAREILRLAGAMDPDRSQERLETAVSALASIGLSRALMDGVRSDSPTEAMVAVEAMARIGGPEVSLHLMDEFWQRDRDLQREIAKALVRGAGEEAVEFFLDVLDRHEDGTVLKGALRFLGDRGGPEVGERVFLLLDHPYPDVKESALDACIALDGDEMVRRFRDLARSPEPMKRLMGVYALGRTDAREHLDDLRRALGDEEPDIRKTAIESLESLCGEDRDALALIVPCLSDESRDVRLTVVDILGRRGGPEGKVYLLQSLGDSDDWVRVRAMEALSEQRAEDAIPLIVPLLESSNKFVMLKAIEALGAIGGRSAFRALLETLSMEDPEVQNAAEEAIAKIQEELGEMR